MQINVSTRHGHLSQETQEKITEKIAKLSRLFERLTAAEVTIELGNRDDPTVEVRVSVERAEHFVAADRSGNLLASVDGVIHKLEQQLRKHKEKIKGHRTPGHRHQEVVEESESEVE